MTSGSTMLMTAESARASRSSYRPSVSRRRHPPPAAAAADLERHSADCPPPARNPRSSPGPDSSVSIQPGLAAVAGRARPLGRCRPRHRIVPPFPAHGVGAYDDPAVDGETTADAGAENDSRRPVNARLQRRPWPPTARGNSRRWPAAPRSRAPRERSTPNGRPMSHVEFAFLTRPVAGEIAPGIPMPTVDRPDLCFRIGDERPDRLQSPFVASPRRRHATTQDLRTAAIDGDDFELRAADVDSYPHAPSTGRWFRSIVTRGRRCARFAWVM